mgnify:CR=1 FL=1
MIIQILLVVALFLLFIRLLKSRNTSKTRAYKKLLLIFFIVGAIIVVIFPKSIQYIADLVGVGRGADLLLYGVTVVVIFGLLNDYVKDKEEAKRIVILARRIALLEAGQREFSENQKTSK